jgi:hypothetical protein
MLFSALFHNEYIELVRKFSPQDQTNHKKWFSMRIDVLLIFTFFEEVPAIANPLTMESVEFILNTELITWSLTIPHICMNLF